MTPRRTILHLINTTGPGGAETVFANLARGMDQKRWRSLAVISERGWLHDELRAAGVETYVLDDRGLSALPRYLGALLRLMADQDVCLVHGHLFGPGYIASLLGTLRRVPSIATIHGLPDMDSSERLYRAKLALLSRSSRIVFVSESLRESVLASSRIAAERAAVIVNGVDFDAVDSGRGSALRSDYLGDGEFLVGAVGNIRPAKAYDIFLRAAADLLARYPGYRFVIAGEGEESPLGLELRRLREELGLANRVRFLGFRADARAVLGALDVYALTSRTEGFSISTVEAMGMALPVVATRCGGPEGIIENGITGLLVPNDSPQAVADGVEFFRQHSLQKEQMGRAAQVAARSRYSLVKQIAEYEQLYEDLLE